MTIAAGGVLPNIHQVLLPKPTGEKCASLLRRRDIVYLTPGRRRLLLITADKPKKSSAWLFMDSVSFAYPTAHTYRGQAGGGG